MSAPWPAELTPLDDPISDRLEDRLGHLRPEDRPWRVLGRRWIVPEPPRPKGSA
jgi:hypothetical protein